MKTDVCVVFWRVLLAVSFSTYTVEPSGSIVLQLNSLQNAKNQNYKGSCCSGAHSGCKPCEYKLEIWVTCDGWKGISACLYGHSKTGIFPKTSKIVFNGALGSGLKNPLVYNFATFRGTLAFQILATDQSGSKIDDYKYLIPFYPDRYSKKKWTNITLKAGGRSDSRLSLTYSVSCDEYYHGPSCSACIAGWLGPNCNCRITQRNTCDTRTGKKICYPPWYGDNCNVKCVSSRSRRYSCDKKTGRKICRIGWHGKECDQRTPVVPSSSTNTYGTFTSNERISVTPSARKIFPSGIISIPQDYSHHQTSGKPLHTSLCVSPSCTTWSFVAMSNYPTSKLTNTWTRTAISLRGTSPTVLLTEKITSIRTDVASRTSSLSNQWVSSIKSFREHRTSIKVLRLVKNQTSQSRKPNSVNQTPFLENSSTQSTDTTANAGDHRELKTLSRITKSSVTVAHHIPPESKRYNITPTPFLKKSSAQSAGTTGNTEELRERTLNSLSRIPQPSVSVIYIPADSKLYNVIRTPSLKTTGKKPSSTFVSNGNHEDFELRSQKSMSTITVALTTPDSKHYSVSHTTGVIATSSDRTQDPSENVEDHSKKLEIISQTIKSSLSVTTGHHIITKGKPYVTEIPLLNTFIKYPARTFVKVGNYTEKLESLSVLTSRESTSIVERHASRVIKHYNSVIKAALLKVTPQKFASRKTAKKREIWWLLVLPVVALVPVILTVLAIIKKRQRKQCKVTPQYDTSLEDIKQQTPSNVSPYKEETDDNFAYISVANSCEKIVSVSI